MSEQQPNERGNKPISTELSKALGMALAFMPIGGLLAWAYSKRESRIRLGEQLDDGQATVEQWKSLRDGMIRLAGLLGRSRKLTALATKLCEDLSGQLDWEPVPLVTDADVLNHLQFLRSELERLQGGPPSEREDIRAAELALLRNGISTLEAALDLEALEHAHARAKETEATEPVPAEPSPEANLR